MDDSRMPMSGMAAYTPGMEITGGSLGHGLGIAVGAALGLKRKKNPAFVYNMLSDGELGEGSTWEAVMSAVQWKLDNLIAIVDFNNQQADGPTRDALAVGKEAPKWAAFGWYAQEVDGNDLDAVVEAFDNARSHEGDCPRVIICNTKMCKGIPFLEDREVTHFIRVEADEWAKALTILDEEKPA
jgi:transketolase